MSESKYELSLKKLKRSSKYWVNKYLLCGEQMSNFNIPFFLGGKLTNLARSSTLKRKCFLIWLSISGCLRQMNGWDSKAKAWKWNQEYSSINIHIIFCVLLITWTDDVVYDVWRMIKYLSPKPSWGRLSCHLLLTSSRAGVVPTIRWWGSSRQALGC